MNPALRQTVCFLVISTLLAVSASAQLLVEESFNYAAASSIGSATTAGFSGNWRYLGTPANVTAGSLGYTDGNGAVLGTSNNQLEVGDDRRAQASFDTSGGGALGSYVDGTGNIGADNTTLYLSILMQCPTGTAGFAAFELNRDSDSDSERVMSIDLSTLNHGGSSNYFFTTYSGGFVDTGYDLSTSGSTTQFFVIRFDFASGADTFSVYANPTLGTEPGEPMVTGTFSDLSFDRIGFANFVDPGTTILFDELRLGTSYAAVTAIPEPGATAAFAGLAALVMGLGFARNRKAR